MIPRIEVLEYLDPIEGFRGFCVYDRNESRLAAGGCRVQRGLTAALLETLAAKMTVKERLLGLGVDGAKCGIDYDFRSPSKAAALGRFVAFLRDELQTRLSLGSDMGTRWHELERIAARQGIASVKVAIRRAQELSDEEFFARLRLLDERVGLLTLGERRAGHALGWAVLASARHPARLTCSLQGFGNLGRAAAETLHVAGACIVAVADEYGCIAAPHGLDVPELLSIDPAAPVGWGLGYPRLPRERLAAVPADVCILAAGENGFTADDLDRLAAWAVVVGANCGLAPEVELALITRGVLVIPDVIGGIGGAASMEAVFGPEELPTAEGVLKAVAAGMDALVDDVLCASRTRGIPIRQVALDMAACTEGSRDQRPYGHSVYLSPARMPTSRRGRQPSRTNVVSASGKVLR
jgi:glutamate dehydrogenase (NAD(P)+)